MSNSRTLSHSLPRVVPKGTVIPVELLNRLSTKNLKEGDNVYAQTIFPITVNNQIVIPVGTHVPGQNPAGGATR